MFSRAHLIIKSEIEDANKEKGLNVLEANQNSIFELVALVEGLPQTIWQDGVFQVYIKFESTYNQTPPQVFFQTIPFHPNIDKMTGRPSLDFLDEPSKWRQSYTLKFILKQLQYLLAYPFLDRAVNMDAVFLLKDNPQEYEKVVKQSIIATKRIREILKAQKNVSSKEIQNDLIINPNVDSKFSNATDTLTRFPLFKIKNEDAGVQLKREGSENSDSNYNLIKNISFDDYSKLWFGIATTKSMKDEQNSYLNENLLNNPNLLAQHISISLNELEEQVFRQLTEHRNVMYGRFSFENGNKTSLRTGSAKKVIAPPKNRAVNYNSLNQARSSDNSNPSLNQVLKIKTTVADDENFEQEVDQLLNWTKNI
jgi:ubiquitin-protein ligase